MVRSRVSFEQGDLPRGKSSHAPNFFVVGAAKSGTSTLADALNQHPDVFVAPVKEPFFFVEDFGDSDWQGYLSLFRNAGAHRAIGEASTGYLYCAASPGMIHTAFPAARIIIILRHPAEMAFSLWQFMRQVGSETLSFREAIAAESSRAKDMAFRQACANWWANYLYVERARYYPQVKRFIDRFGTDAVYITTFERFIATPGPVMSEIYGHIGADQNFKPQLRHVNCGGSVRFTFLQRIRNGRYPYLKRWLPQEMRWRLRRLVSRVNLDDQRKAYLDTRQRAELCEMLREDTLALAQFVDITPWGLP